MTSELVHGLQANGREVELPRTAVKDKTSPREREILVLSARELQLAESTVRFTASRLDPGILICPEATADRPDIAAFREWRSRRRETAAHT